MSKIQEKFPIILLLIYIILFIVCAIRPYARDIWIAENLPIVIIVGILIYTYRMYRFSNTAYALMAVLIFMHTIGGHYTFERVPFSFVTNLFGFERNHYDRIAHFSVGFYAFAIAEIIDKKKISSNHWILWLFPIFAIAFVAAGYEIIEWLFAILSDPNAGGAFLGSQGDIRDAQKDMLADISGAILATALYMHLRKKRKNSKK